MWAEGLPVLSGHGTWIDASAKKITETLHESWEIYPHRHTYRKFPGPNSNTFVAWVFREAGIEHRLSWRGIGERYAMWNWRRHVL